MSKLIEKDEDIINKPNHYHKNEIDVNGYLEKHFPKEPNMTVAEGFYIGNIIKYVSRHKEKNGIEDLKKALFNLNKLIGLEEGLEIKSNKRLNMVLRLQEENLKLAQDIEQLKQMLRVEKSHD